jgi:hypothetical protein
MFWLPTATASVCELDHLPQGALESVHHELFNGAR